MIPSQLPAMIRVELRAVFARASGISAVVLSFAIGLACVAAMQQAAANMDAASVNGMPIGAMMSVSAATCAGWALQVRSFFLLPLLLLLATGATFAGELADNTLRETLVRPVPRWSVLVAKLVALMGVSAASLVAALVPTMAGGALLFGTDDQTVAVLLGYLASLGSDLGFIAFGLLAGTIVRSVGRVVVSVAVLMVLNIGLSVLLMIREKFLGWIRPPEEMVVEPLLKAAELLPLPALRCWTGWSEGWVWENFAGLALLVGLSLALTLWRFGRMDI